MTKMLSFLQVEKNSVLEAWKDISCTSFNQKVNFYDVFSFFVYIILSLGVDRSYKSGNPGYKTLILIFEECNICIGLVVYLHCKLQFNLVRQLVYELQDISLLFGMIVFYCFGKLVKQFNVQIIFHCDFVEC